MRVALAFAAVILIACGPQATREANQAAQPSSSAWRNARQSMKARQGSDRVGPYSEMVRVKLREASSGKTFEAEGAIAVDPGRAFRMMLVGPGGVTAVDAWGTKNAFLFSVPPIQLLRAGGSESPPGLPIGFFRWWFLSRWSGTLLWASSRAGESQWILRNDDAVVVLADSDGRRPMRAERRAPSGVERIEWSASAARDSVGDHGHYVDEASGLQVDIEVVALSKDPPDPEAFTDPREHAREP